MAVTHGLRSVLGLDIGTKRTGVAKANEIVRIAQPLSVITDVTVLPESVDALIQEHDVIALAIGLPRNLSGEKTDQTRYVEVLAAKITKYVSIPVYFMDEAVTSVQAEATLRQRGAPYTKADIDMLAATYILEDFLNTHPEVFDATI